MQLIMKCKGVKFFLVVIHNFLRIKTNRNWNFLNNFNFFNSFTLISRTMPKIRITIKIKTHKNTYK